MMERLINSLRLAIDEFRTTAFHSPFSRQKTATRSSRRLTAEVLEDRHMLAVTVNTLVDEADGSIVDGDISLRDAIALAPANETINFNPSLFSGGMQTINLTVGANNSQKHLTISRSLTIQGPGSNLLTLKAFDPDVNGTNDSDGSRAFLVNDGNSLNQAIVHISGVTITGGDVAGTGGGIDNTENLTLTNVSVIENAGRVGGGVHSSGPLVLNQCTISGNASLQLTGGGGISVTGTVSAMGSLTINNSAILNNSARFGGGLFFSSGHPAASLTVTNSTISGNQSATDGGGIVLYAPQQGAKIVATTVSNNAAAGDGGGIFIGAGDFQTLIRTSTISGNTAANGGGIYAYSYGLGGNFRVENSTVSNNSAGAGGGLFLRPSAHQYMDIRSATITLNRSSMGGGINGNGRVNLKNTIVSGNSSSDGVTANNIQGTLDPLSSYNLVGTNGDGGLSPLLGNHVGINNPQLASLANNGGPTSTHAPLSGSPVINNGDPKRVFSRFEADQRGTSSFRVLSGRIDIGSVESAGPGTNPLPTTGANLGSLVPNLNFESYNTMPTSFSQMNTPGQTVIAWAQLTDGTSDYMNADGFMGSVNPADGPHFARSPVPQNGSKGFVGVYDLDPPSHGFSYHEYVVNALPVPLTVGTTYQLDVFSGTTSGEGFGHGGAYVGQLVMYGLLDASQIPNYKAPINEWRPINEFAAGNFVELLAVDVDQAASTWTSFPYQTFTPQVPVQAIVFGARTVRPNSYLLIDAANPVRCPLGDYNQNGVVDTVDYIVWRNTLGQNVANPFDGADGDGDGVIDQDDYYVWIANFGKTCGGQQAAQLAIAPGDYNMDGVVNSDDRNVWKLSFGSKSDLRADGSGNGVVDLADLAIWQEYKGVTTLDTIEGDFNSDGVVDMTDFGQWQSTQDEADFYKNFGIIRGDVFPLIVSSSRGKLSQLPHEAPQAAGATLVQSLGNHPVNSLTAALGFGEQPWRSLHAVMDIVSDKGHEARLVRSFRSPVAKTGDSNALAIELLMDERGEVRVPGLHAAIDNCGFESAVDEYFDEFVELAHVAVI